MNVIEYFKHIFCGDYENRISILKQLLEEKETELRKCIKKCKDLEARARLVPTFRFTDTKRIVVTGLRLALAKAFPKAEIKTADRDYDTVERKELEKWLKEDALSTWKWEQEYWDCDDFADELKCRAHLIGRIQKKNFAIGIAWGKIPGGYHAFNIGYVMNNGKEEVVIIEPQNDRVFSYKNSNYEPLFIKI